MAQTHQIDDWRCHGWDDHIIGQLEHGRSLTFRQKLEWLEEAHQLARRLQSARVHFGPKTPREWVLNESTKADEEKARPADLDDGTKPERTRKLREKR